MEAGDRITRGACNWLPMRWPITMSYSGFWKRICRGVEFNRYNLEVYLSIAQLYRQNLEMLFGVDRMNSLVESAQRAAAQGKAKDARGISG